MKFNFFSFLLIIISLVACRKDDPITDPIQPLSPKAYSEKVTDYYPLTVGSYWVYHIYQIDTNMIEKFISTDTVSIVKDTVINNRTFYLKKSRYNYGQLISDSSNYIINQNGVKLFSHTNFTDTIAVNTIPNILTSYSIMSKKGNIVKVPAGTFTSVLELDIITYSDDANYAYGSPRTLTTHFAKDVGIVKEGYFYYFQPSRYEKRLISYYLAP
jgi:hypothetical protein